MPLSEDEQKILEQIEKSLYREDPDFARGVKRSAPQAGQRRRAKLGILIFVIGFAVLVAFFVTSNIVVGVAAFGAMVAGIVLLSGSVKGLAFSRGGPDSSPRARLARTFEQWETHLRKRKDGS